MIQIDSDKKRVLEIGCGGGAALKALSFINNKLEIYGIDYSQNLIKLAKRAIKNGNFVCDEAINIDSIFAMWGGGCGFNFIFSNSAFHYFPNEEYVFSVIRKAYSLLTKGGTLALLDLNDIKTKDIYNAIRKGNMTEDEYNKKYEGLNHLFLSRTKIFEFVESLGFEKIIVENQHIKGYINNECRFNVFALSKK